MKLVIVNFITSEVSQNIYKDTPIVTACDKFSFIMSIPVGDENINLNINKKELLITKSISNDTITLLTKARAITLFLTDAGEVLNLYNRIKYIKYHKKFRKEKNE